MEDVVARFRAGDTEAVRAVYQHYGPAIHTVARSFLADRELANEVVQQTFVKAWRASGTFEEGRELAPWLYAIARRTAIEVMRRELRPTLGGHDPETDVVVLPVSFERTWEIHQVRQAIDQLPPDEREVVRLSHLIGLTHQEIADRLAVPLGTVKSRSNRAHKRLVVALGHLPDVNQTTVAPAVERERT